MLTSFSTAAVTSAAAVAFFCKKSLPQPPVAEAGFVSSGFFSFVGVEPNWKEAVGAGDEDAPNVNDGATPVDAGAASLLTSFSTAAVTSAAAVAFFCKKSLPQPAVGRAAWFSSLRFSDVVAPNLMAGEAVPKANVDAGPLDFSLVSFSTAAVTSAAA